MGLSVADHHIAGAIAWAVCVALSIVFSALGPVVKRLACCCSVPAETWSPLFVHPGYVFFSELGQDVQPNHEPPSLVPDNVDMCVGIMEAKTAAKKKLPNKSWTQQYESEQRR